MKYYEFVAWSCRKPFWLIFTTAASVSIGCCFTAGTSREHSWFPAFLHSSVPRLTVGAQIPQSLELRRQSVLWMNWLLKTLPWHMWFWFGTLSICRGVLARISRMNGLKTWGWIIWILWHVSNNFTCRHERQETVAVDNGWYCSCVMLAVWVVMALTSASEWPVLVRERAATQLEVQVWNRRLTY